MSITQGYSTLIVILTHLTRKDVKFLINVKSLLKGLSMHVLSLPIFGERYEAICDVSLLGTGVILLQKARPIVFESRKFTPTKRNYTIGEQELIAVVHALQT